MYDPSSVIAKISILWDKEAETFTSLCYQTEFKGEFMKMQKFVAAAAVLTFVAACTQQNGAPNAGILNGGGFNKQDIGTAAGVIGGGVLGSTIGGGHGKIAATI